MKTKTKITYLSGIEEPLELLHKLCTLISSRLGVQEDQDGVAVGTGDRLQAKRPLLVDDLNHALIVLGSIN